MKENVFKKMSDSYDSKSDYWGDSWIERWKKQNEPTTLTPRSFEPTKTLLTFGKTHDCEDCRERSAANSSKREWTQKDEDACWGFSDD